MTKSVSVITSVFFSIYMQLFFPFHFVLRMTKHIQHIFSILLLLSLIFYLKKRMSASKLTFHISMLDGNDHQFTATIEKSAYTKTSGSVTTPARSIVMKFGDQKVKVTFEAVDDSVTAVRYAAPAVAPAPAPAGNYNNNNNNNNNFTRQGEKKQKFNRDYIPDHQLPAGIPRRVCFCGKPMRAFCKKSVEGKYPKGTTCFCCETDDCQAICYEPEWIEMCQRRPEHAMQFAFDDDKILLRGPAAGQKRFAPDSDVEEGAW